MNDRGTMKRPDTFESTLPRRWQRVRDGEASIGERGEPRGSEVLQDRKWITKPNPVAVVAGWKGWRWIVENDVQMRY